MTMIKYYQNWILLRWNNSNTRLLILEQAKYVNTGEQALDTKKHQEKWKVSCLKARWPIREMVHGWNYFKKKWSQLGVVWYFLYIITERNSSDNLYSIVRNGKNDMCLKPALFAHANILADTKSLKFFKLKSGQNL